MDTQSVPVVLFMFKRVDSTLKVVEQIRVVKPRRMYLLSDNGRDAEERKLVQDVRAAVESAIDWPCEVIKNYATDNRGVYENIALGARWVFEREDVAIFLEDDNVPEPTFFGFCAELLGRYRLDTRVLWICGTNYLGEYHPTDGASYVFTQHLLPCGWASWAEKFRLFYDFNLDLLDSPSLVHRVKAEYSDARLYRQQLASVLSERAHEADGGQYESWDHHMAWSIRAHGLYGISPARNQIQNIGADEYSAHGGTSMNLEMTRRFLGMKSYPIEEELRHPVTVLPDLEYERLISSIILLPFTHRFKAAARRLLGRMFRLPSTMSVSDTVRSRIRKALQLSEWGD